MSGEPGTQSRGSRLRSHIGWWVGIASAALGILAFFLTQCKGEGPSFNEWRSKADSICEQEFPQIVQGMRYADGLYTALLEHPSPEQADRDAAGDAHEDVSVSIRHLVGSWRALDQPDERREQIDKLHAAGSSFSDAYGSYAAAIYDGDEIHEGYLEQETSAIAALYNQAKVLNLEQCKAQIGNPDEAAAE
ncbi:hypothetical protein ACHGLA_10815 [Streptomyces sp. YH02]|uniref:hypothetical protein n=1 Tax=Streptomyces sp. YH02 TaxID=3256999 RepID=UPI003756C847